MARRIPFSIAQPITIVGWYTTGFILVGLVAAAAYAPSMQLAPEDNEYLSQAFYYAILAAGLYIIVASLMVITVFGAHKGHYEKDFNLTMSQRTLMLQTIAYLVYLLGGAAVFAHIEDWLFLNGVWWANFTLLTIGIGDYRPITHLGQSLLFPYAIGGIVILGLVIGSIRSLVLDRGEKKIAARMVEKQREHALSQLPADHKKEKNIRLGFTSKVRFKPQGKSEYHRRGEEFRLMRRIQQHTESRRKWMALLVSSLLTLTLWLVGAAIFYVAEREPQDMTYFEAIYFTYTSLLTIGYGDYSLTANASKPAFVFWSFIAVPALTVLISNMGDTVVKLIRDATIWLGELTVLPGEASTTQKIKKGAKMVKEGKLPSIPNVGAEGGPVEEPTGGVSLPGQDRTGGGRAGESAKAHDQSRAVADRLGTEFEAEELDSAFDAREKGDELGADVHLYHYLLVKEIRNVMKDVSDNPDKKYSYHEWAWFMRLLGEDENDPKFHRRPKSVEGEKKEMEEEDGGNEKDGQDGKNVSSGTGNKNSEKEGGLQKKGGEDENTPWSWVGIRSPLLGEQEEAQWVLEKLSDKLEGELRLQRENARRSKKGEEEKGRRRPPPVTRGSRGEERSPEGSPDGGVRQRG